MPSSMTFFFFMLALSQFAVHLKYFMLFITQANIFHVLLSVPVFELKMSTIDKVGFVFSPFFSSNF